MGNICPPNKNSPVAHQSAGGRGAAYIANESGGVKAVGIGGNGAGPSDNNNASYPIRNMANGSVGFDNINGKIGINGKHSLVHFILCTINPYTDSNYSYTFEINV